MADHEDCGAAFIRYAAARRRTAGARGAVVSLSRWHLPMLGRQHAAELPPLRNLRDARRWAASVQQGEGSAEFISAMGRMWREFIVASFASGELDVVARDLALSAEDLDGPARGLALRQAVVEAWAAEVASHPVTASELVEAAPAVCEAISNAIGHEGKLTPKMVASYISRELCPDMAAGAFAVGRRIRRGNPDRAAKRSRWLLESAPNTGS